MRSHENPIIVGLDDEEIAFLITVSGLVRYHEGNPYELLNPVKAKEALEETELDAFQPSEDDDNYVW